MVSAFSSITGRHKGPTRLLIRVTGLTIIAAVSLCSIIYLTWFLPGFSAKTQLARLLPTAIIKSGKLTEEIHWSDSPRRLIVFGDSWSDNGLYPVDPPPRDQSPTKDVAQGKVWTEWLCSAIFCTHHDNFARSLPYSWDSGYSGAVVDSSLLNTTMANTTISNSSTIMDYGIAEPLADLKTQVQQWLKFEKQQYDNSRVKGLERNGTVFTMWFSLWDLWYYSEKTIDEAEVAVLKTLDTLFEQLDLIAENWPSEMKIIIPEAIDTTFLPGWFSLRTGPRGTDPHGECQRNAVLLVEQWNRALDIRATRWTGGSMYIYNTNEWLLDQVREQQLYTSHLSDANGMGSSQPSWDNVRSGCVEVSNDVGESVSRCTNPNTYLFWDEMHLGPEAMKIIGESIAHDIAANGENSWFAHDTKTTYSDPSPKSPVDGNLPVQSSSLTALPTQNRS